MKFMYNVYDFPLKKMQNNVRIRIAHFERQGNGMQVNRQNDTFTLYKENQPIGHCVCRLGKGWQLERLVIDPQWRGKGYGSFLLKQVLKATDGYAKQSLHTAPVPTNEAAEALLKKFGFAAEKEQWVRRRVADPTAVSLTHTFLQQRLQPGGFFVDATCGNGGDTEFLCRIAGQTGRVLALDLQQQAVENTNHRLQKAGLDGIGRAIQADHARLAELVQPQTADCIVFNFGYLPGGSHDVFTTPKSSLPAVQAALAALRPGGVLAACLYSGGPNGSEEKQTLLQFFRSLPIVEYTVLICEFGNWADTAPLPCFVIKRGK